MNTKKQYFGFGNIIKYFFMFCGVTFIYGLIKGLRLFDRGLFVLYLGDFSIGKCSRFLIGSVISIFRDTYTKEWIYSFNLVFLILIFILCGYYISSAAASSKKSNTLPVMIVSAIFIMCPFSFASIYGSRYFGLLDIYEFLVFLLCIMLGKNKYLFYLIPFLCAAGVFIHDSYILVYLCPCLAVCAYYAVKRHKKSIPALTGFGVSSAAGFAASVFVVFFSQSTIKMSEAQVMEYLAAKGQCSVNEVSGYIEQYLFNKNVSSSLDIDYGSDIWEMLKYMAAYNLNGMSPVNIVQFLSVLPFIIFMYRIWIKCAKRSSGFFGKIPYILFMLTPVPVAVSLILSTDFDRFLATIIITQCFYLFMCVKEKDKNVSAVLSYIRRNLYLLAMPCFFIFLGNMA